MHLLPSKRVDAPSKKDVKCALCLSQPAPEGAYEGKNVFVGPIKFVGKYVEVGRSELTLSGVNLFWQA